MGVHFRKKRTTLREKKIHHLANPLKKAVVNLEKTGEENRGYQRVQDKILPGMRYIFWKLQAITF